jgi:2-(1,2-epoxy-1,2-dihydrophenyl)acetyl-CoA isomerase
VSSVSWRVEHDTAYVTLRGAKRNALSRSVYHELGDCLEEIALRPDIRFVVLAGADGVFSSGGDLTELQNGLPQDYLDDYLRRMHRSVVAIGMMDQIVISVIEGAAIGAGAALAMSADIVLAEATAQMRLSFVHIGYVPDAGVTWLLPRNAGFAVARDMLLTGRSISMQEARQSGLISRIAEPGCLSALLESVLEELRLAPPRSLALTKHLINTPEREAMTSALRAEGATQPVAAAAQDTNHLVAAVLDGMRRSGQEDNEPRTSSRHDAPEDRESTCTTDQ